MPSRPADLFIYRDRILWLSQSFSGAQTQRPAPALLLGLHGPLQLHFPDGQSCQSRAFLVGPQVAREIDAREVGFFSLNLDSATAWGHVIRKRLGSSAVLDIAGECSDALFASALELESQAHSCTSAYELSEKVLRLLFAMPPLDAIDHRIVRVATYLQDQLPTRLKLDELAAISHLSPGRLSHLFREQSGVPMRSYLQWLKMQRAASLFAKDRSMTEVAAEIGFTDAAHLCHVFRGYFSVNPSWLADSDQVNVRDCVCNAGA